MYVNESRSMRSQEAIESFVVPYSMITKSEISKFRDSDYNIQDGTDKPYSNKIFKLPATIWRYVATNIIGASEWHHTGKYYRKTEHYDMNDIADYLSNHYSDVLQKYHKMLKDIRSETKDEEKQPVMLTKLEVEDWVGSRNYRHMDGTYNVYGYLDGEWLIAFDDSQSRYDITANKVVNEWDFANLHVFKKYNKNIDLRKFKPFLHRHHVYAREYSDNADDNKYPYSELYHLDQMTQDEIKYKKNHGLYPFYFFDCLDKEGHLWNPDNLCKQVLSKLGIMIKDSTGWHLSSKYNDRTDFEVKYNPYDDNEIKYLYTPLFFTYLSKVMKRHGYKIPKSA